MLKCLKLIAGFAKPHKFKLIIVLATVLMTTYIVEMYPYLFGKLVDSLFYQRDMSVFLRILLIYIIIFLINQMLHFILNMTVAKIRIQYLFDIKRYIYRKILSYKSATLSNMNSGDVIYRINHDTDEIMSLIYGDIFYGLSSVLDFFLCLGMTAFINVYLATISVALAILTFLLGKYFSDKIKSIHKKLVESLAGNESWLFEFFIVCVMSSCWEPQKTASINI